MMEATDKFGSFHEAFILGIRREHGSISILLENIHVNDEVRNGCVHLRNVTQITRDDSPVDEMTMEEPDGEVLTLTTSPGAVCLIVEWKDYKHHRKTTRAYDIACEAIEVEVT